MYTIYKITNNAIKKVYIGVTKQTVKIRWYQHRAKLEKSIHHNAMLQEDWNNYGSEYFTFEVIEECPDEEAWATETRWIGIYRTYSPAYGYNIYKHKTEFEKSVS